MNSIIRKYALLLGLMLALGSCSVAPTGLVLNADNASPAVDAGAEVSVLDAQAVQDVGADAENKADTKVSDSGLASDTDTGPPEADTAEVIVEDVLQDVAVDTEGTTLDAGTDEGALDSGVVPVDSGTEPPVSLNDCCYAHGEQGCSEESCSDLVCAVNPLCCVLEWNAGCALAAVTVCSECNISDAGACCVGNDSAYCGDFDCVNKVCAVDSYCCEFKWDSFCANKANEMCSDCNLSDAGDCCESTGSPYCENLTCVQAVCEKDDYCCTGKWDTFCANCAKGETTFEGTSCADVVSQCECVITHEDLAEHWSPGWYQDTDDTDAQADYIVAYDFDGDFKSENNWENLHTAAADLSAVIYWSMVETETHWYILYADFHPRDWTEDCDPLLPFVNSPCHENDMEGAMVVVKKDGSPWGEFQVLYTEAHNFLHIFTNNTSITAGSNLSFHPGLVSFEDGSHPELYVESKGHGVCALLFEGGSHCQHPVTPGQNYFPGGDGIVYRFKGVAEVPEGGNDQDVGYALVPLETTLWTRRFDICDDGCTFDGNMNYMGVNFGKSFDGETWKDDAANPPWAWDDPADGVQVQRGDFFFRPAHTYLQHVNGQGETSQVYLHNPYLFSIPGLLPP